jgi:threonylcarbamoyladenosine tRNA methylthiotransferase MtaB
MRVRLGSLEPDHITDEVIEGLAENEKFCPQFHISLQSGCDRTLKNMNRHYISDEYKELCNKLRKTFENATITTDIMVGFHDETIEDFNESLDFVKNIGFEKVHVFPYSERVGTVASKRGDNVPKEEKERRATIMINETQKIRIDYFESLIGTKAKVLFENQLKDGTYQGYTKNYIPVRIKSDKDIIGQEIEVTIKSVDINQDCCFA